MDPIDNIAVLSEKISNLNNSITILNKRIDDMIITDKEYSTKIENLKVEVEKFKSSASMFKIVGSIVTTLLGTMVFQLYLQNIEWNKTQDSKIDTIYQQVQTNKLIK